MPNGKGPPDGGKVIRTKELEAGIAKPGCFGYYLPTEMECAKCFYGGQGPGFECPRHTKERNIMEQAKKDSTQRQRNLHILRNALTLLDKMYEGLELGIIHKSKKDGRVLEHPREMIRCLIEEGEIECTAPPELLQKQKEAKTHGTVFGDGGNQSDRPGDEEEGS